MTDKRKLYIISASVTVALLIIFFIPFETAGRVIAALTMAAAAVVATVMLKKRAIPSMNKHQVLLIMAVITVVYLMLYYLTGLEFGFEKNPSALAPNYFVERFIPVAVIIVSSEIFRYVVRAEESRLGDAFAYVICLLAELIACSTASVAVSSFNRFMELVAETLFPALVAHLLYHYLTKRYGQYPSMIFRAGTTLYIYFIPIIPSIARSLHAFVDLIVPMLIYFFIDALFEKKKRYALVKRTKLGAVITVLAIVIMLSCVMLISNQFEYGMLVVATESMTGEINKGDAVIYQRYDDEVIIEGQVIVFDKNGSKIIHRVDKIEIIDGVARYYTKGDANDDIDSGYITKSNVVGLVGYKIPYIGYPTIWLRSLFKR